MSSDGDIGDKAAIEKEKKKIEREDDDDESMTSDNESVSSVDSEYAPSEHRKDASASDSSDEDENERSNATAPVNSSCDSSTYSLQASFNVPGNSACDERNQIAEMSHGAKGGQKKNFCFYCKSEQSKIARHLTNKHADKEEVKRFLSLPKKSVERGRIIANIRKKGNFLYNVNGEYNNGKLIPVRRPRQTEKRRGENFIACPRCRGFYSKNNIRHHHRYCAKKTDNSRHVLAEARKTLGRIHESASLVLRQEVFPVLRDDNISRLIRYDKLIILYGNKMCKKLRLAHQHDEIRAHLRRLGRFLEVIQNIEPSITNMTSVFDPKHYDAVVEAVNVLGELNPKTQLYKTPSVPTAIGAALKKLGHILEAECIKDHDAEKKRNAKDFLKLLLDDFGTSVNKGVLETMAKVQRTKKITLPKTDDIRRLDDFLDKAIDRATSQLQNKFNSDSWKDLAEAILIKVQIFNRRRAGEIERLSIEEFENRQCIKDDDELYQKLSERDKISAKKYVRLTIRGKLNRTVPVLMSMKVLDGVKLILKHRKSAAVPSANPFVFGIASTDKKRHRYLRACILMRKFSEACGAQDPSSLRGTTLRKHIATRCADMNLTDNQISSVANFMGHHENIHRNIYRQPVVKSDIVDMSKVLEKAQGDQNASHGSHEHDTNTTEEQSVVTDTNTCDTSSIDITDGMPRHHLMEITPVNRERRRSETPERSVPPKPTKSVGGRQNRMTSTPTRESSSKRKAKTSSLKKENIKKPRRDPVASPNLTAVISESPPKRVTRSSTEGRAAAPQESSLENTPPVAKKKGTKRKAACTTPETSQSSQSSESWQSSQSDASLSNSRAKNKNKAKKKNVTTRVQRKLPIASSTGKKPRWEKDEIQQALECFGSYLNEDKLPSLPMIEQMKKERNFLQGRSAAVVKTWLSNQLRIVRNGGTPQYASNSTPVSRSVLKHAEFIFEDCIAEGRIPSIKDCEDVRKHDKKMTHLSAREIRNIAKSLINE